MEFLCFTSKLSAFFSPCFFYFSILLFFAILLVVYENFIDCISFILYRLHGISFLAKPHNIEEELETNGNILMTGNDFQFVDFLSRQTENDVENAQSSGFFQHFIDFFSSIALLYPPLSLTINSIEDASFEGKTVDVKGPRQWTKANHNLRRICLQENIDSQWCSIEISNTENSYAPACPDLS